MATAMVTRIDQRARSIELAEARGETVCSWHARSIGYTLGEGGDLVNAAWRVASASSDAVYVVTYIAAGDHADYAACECRSAQYGRPCWHAGLALMMGRYLARMYSAAGRAEAERAYRRDLAHEGNARALGF